MQSDKRHPYIKFYGRDWIGDTDLRMCELDERGLWIDLLAIMMACEPYGHLAVKGAAMTDKEAAKLIGIDTVAFKSILNRLEKRGIPSRTPEGILFSRRLVREHGKFMVASISGKKGGGNPALHSDSENHNPESISHKPEAKGPIKGTFIGTFKGTATKHGDQESLRIEAGKRMQELGYVWNPETHTHKMSIQAKFKAYFFVAVEFMIRGGLDLLLKPDDFSVYVHSHFGEVADPDFFFSMDAENSLPRYAITRIGAATDNEIARYGTRLFEFYVKDFNRIYGADQNTKFLKERTEELKHKNRMNR